MSKIIDAVVHELYEIEPGSTEIGFLADFTLLWSIFESKYKNINGSLSLKRIFHVISISAFKQLINVETIKNLPEHIFLKIDENNIMVTISNIEFEISLYPAGSNVEEIPRVKEHFNLIDGVIANSDPKIIDLIFLIIYRLRNNLFHGIKDIYHLSEQNALFDIINKFLAEVLIITKDVKKTG